MGRGFRGPELWGLNPDGSLTRGASRRDLTDFAGSVVRLSCSGRDILGRLRWQFVGRPNAELRFLGAVGCRAKAWVYGFDAQHRG